MKKYVDLILVFGYINLFHGHRISKSVLSCLGL